MTTLPDIDLYDEWIPDDDTPLPTPEAATADTYLRWLGAAQRELDNINQAFNAEVQKLRERQADLTAGSSRRVAELTGLLEDYGRAVRVVDPKTTSIAMVHGTIATRAGSKKVVVEDEAKLIEWWHGLDDEASARLPMVHTEVKVSVSKQEIKTAIKAGSVAVRDDGAVCDTLTGEVLPGISEVTGDVTVTVKPA
jgi:hypothetical protein